MRAAITLVLVLAASPALAGGTTVPEPSSAGLFLLGLAGLIIGRQGARGRRPD